MSLNFVSSAVLSSTDGISHNEEKPIESAEAERARRSGIGTSKPLFEQLQYNRDKAQEQYDEVTKSMRGTRTLDDEDCAHLDLIEEAKAERERQIQRSIDEEVAQFRAARADRSVLGSSLNDEVGIDSNEEITKGTEKVTILAPETDTTSHAPKRKAPIIFVKKRRRQDCLENKSTKLINVSCAEQKITNSVPNDENHKTKVKTTSSLGGLLGCYGSDEESD